MHGETSETIGDRRAGWASRGVVGAKHEMVDQKLRAPSEEVRQRGAATIGLEAILLVHPDPRQLLALARKFVTASGQLLLGLKQLQPSRKPIFACCGLVIAHCFSTYACP